MLVAACKGCCEIPSRQAALATAIFFGGCSTGLLDCLLAFTPGGAATSLDPDSLLCNGVLCDVQRRESPITYPNSFLLFRLMGF